MITGLRFLRWRGFNLKEDWRFTDEKVARHYAALNVNNHLPISLHGFSIKEQTAKVLDMCLIRKFNLSPDEVSSISWDHDMNTWMGRKADVASIAYKDEVRKYVLAITKNMEAFYGVRSF